MGGERTHMQRAGKRRGGWEKKDHVEKGAGKWEIESSGCKVSGKGGM
jgi:hypothetical protein